MHRDDNGDDDDAHSESGTALTIREIKILRRMLRDDVYKRRARAGRRVWILTLGTVASMAAAGATVWRELMTRLLR